MAEHPNIMHMSFKNRHERQGFTQTASQTSFC